MLIYVNQKAANCIGLLFSAQRQCVFLEFLLKTTAKNKGYESGEWTKTEKFQPSAKQWAESLSGW